MGNPSLFRRWKSQLLGTSTRHGTVRRQRRTRPLSFESLEARSLMSANPIPFQFTVPTAIQSQDVYVSITSQLNAPYTNKDGTALQTNDWVYYVPGTLAGGGPDFSTGDYFQADSTTPSSDLTFQLPVSSFSGETLTIDIPQTPVVSGHIVMSIGNAAVVEYANNPKTNEGGISAPTPGGPNYNTVYGLFEYAMAVDPTNTSSLLVDVDMSEVDQVGFPFTITTTPAAPSPTDLGTGINRTRIDMLNLYMEYIYDKGAAASSFRQLLQKTPLDYVTRIMAPNNYVSYAPSPIPGSNSATPVYNNGIGKLAANSYYSYWVTATNGYGESTQPNYQQALTDPADFHDPRLAVLVTWDKVPGATGYNIYRTQTGSSTAQPVGQPQFLGTWTGTVNAQGLPTFTDDGTKATTSRTIPTTNYTYFPQNYYFNNVLNQFFSHYTTTNDSFFIDVPMTMKIDGQSQTAIYSLSGKVVSNFQAQDATNAWHNYTALVLTGTTTKANIQAGFPDTTNQQFAVLRPFFSSNTGSSAYPPAPKWLTNPTESPGQMVFGNDGVFNTGGAQPGVNAQLLSNLQNPIVAAFNRGIATNFSVAPNNWANAPQVTGAWVMPGGTLTADNYYYVVTATNSYGETTGSLEFMQTITADDVTSGHRRIDLNWKADNEPTQYNIYRSLTQGSGYEYLASLPNPNPLNHDNPTIGFADEGQYTPNPNRTPVVYYAPGTTSNWYAGFFHQNSTNNPTTGASIRGLAYGFAYDDQGGNSTNMNDHFTQVNVNLMTWAATQTPPVAFDPTPNTPLDIKILTQPTSGRVGSQNIFLFKAFGPQGQAFIGNTMVKVEVVGAQTGTYEVNVDPVSGRGRIIIPNTTPGYSYLKLTQADGTTYRSNVFYIAPVSIPLNLISIFGQESNRLSKINGFYTALDQIARSRR